MTLHATGESYRTHPGIFREYDIRGIVSETLGEEDAYHIGRAFATEIALRHGENPTLCVGRDGRLSSPALEEALIRGLMASGAQVVSVGLGPTPMLYFAAFTLHAAGAVMVTGSHNPPTHNGFKMMSGAHSFFGADIKQLSKRIAAQEYMSAPGAYSEQSVAEDYLAKLLDAYQGPRPLKVAWDAGNGAAGGRMAALAARLPGEHILLNETIDGRFPAHHPDPTVPENLEQLIATVKQAHCDLGIAFDGDGDRIGVVDGRGRILWGDQLMAIYARDVLREAPGATIIADVKASQALFDEIARAGGNPLMWKTGHSLVKAKMAETGAKLAGEMSGHIFFADRYYGFDDALYAAVRLIDILSRSHRTLAEMRDSLPACVNTPEIRFPCDDARKFAVIEEVSARLKQQGADFSTIDGVRVNTPDGWWLLRASNTQAMLVARCESVSETGLIKLKTMLSQELAKSGLALPENFSAPH